jgi:hypothetical protein
VEPGFDAAHRGLLSSWKEIAKYLGCGVRTVQRWEQQRKLPIHRIGAGPKAPVFAFEGELRTYRRTAIAKAENPGGAVPLSKWRAGRQHQLSWHRDLVENTSRLVIRQRDTVAMLLETVNKRQRHLAA